MALLVLAFAVALALGRRPPASDGPPLRGGRGRWRCAARGRRACSPTASPAWSGSRSRCRSGSALDCVAGGLRVGPGARCARRSAATAGDRRVAVVAVADRGRGSAGRADRRLRRPLGDVQASTGRLSSPVFPGEALGIWPEGDFRVVRGEVTGALSGDGARPARAPARGMVAFRAPRLRAARDARRRGDRLRRREAVRQHLRRGQGAGGDGAAGGPGRPRRPVLAAEGRRPAPCSVGFGSAVAVAGVPPRPCWRCAPPRSASTSAAGARGARRRMPGPHGRLPRRRPLRRLLAARDADRSPGGYVPPRSGRAPRRSGSRALAMDLDTLSAGRLDEFRYAITTRAAYQSTPPPNFEPVAAPPPSCSGGAGGPDPAPAASSTSDGTPGRAARLRHRGGTRGSRRADDGHRCCPTRCRGMPGLEPRLAVRRAGDRDPAAGARPGALAALAAVPQPGAADGLGRPGAGSSCRRRSTACT